MKESLVWLFILLTISNLVLAKKTELVVDLMEHGVTSPRFTENPAYRVTSNTYKEFPGELTEPGVFQMEAKGKQLKKEFIEDQKLLPTEFKPENFYQKSYSDQPSTLSAYAYMLGAYPDSVSWIQYQSMGGGTVEAPFTKEEETDVRKTLGLSLNPSRLTTRDITVWSETDGRTFFNDPLNNCPQMHKEMTQNLDIATSKYTDNKRFDALYEEMEKTLGVPDETLTFKNAHLYLDDYSAAQANNKPFPKFEEQMVADTWISNYYRRYYYEGRYGESSDLSRVASNHFFTYLMTSMYGKYKVAKGEITNDHYEHLKYAQFVGNENSLIAADKLINDMVLDPILPPRFGSNLRFELFENGGAYFVKSTMDDKPVVIRGANEGVLPYEDFMKYIYGLLYFGDVDKYCSGQESTKGKDKPTQTSYEKYIWEQHAELRGETKAAATQTQNTGYSEQKFVEIEQKKTPTVVEVVEPIYVQRPAPPPEGRLIYNYQNDQQRPVERRAYSGSTSSTRQGYTRPRAQESSYRSQYQSSQGVQSTQGAVATSRSQESQDSGFAQMVESAQCVVGESKEAKVAVVEKYNPFVTTEHKADIPYLHPVDIPQVIHDTRVVVVPKTVTKAVIHEKLVTEKPTEIHHIELHKEQAAPVAFAEIAPVAAGWPWWWWIPLLLLCCCLPLCCCLLWWLCCRSKPKPKPKPKPEPVSRPPRQEAIVQKAKPKPRDETEIQQQKKFTYTKNKIDQEAEIEAEIQRELEVSRIRKTDIQRDKDARPVVYHHTRYIEKPRIVEDLGVTAYDRTATYDAVNRSASKYQHIDDSYYLQQQPERVERVVERTYAPGVAQIDSRRSVSQGRARKSVVNPQYQAEMAGGNSRRSGEGYVSREQVNAPNRYLEIPGSQRQQLQTSIRREQDVSPRMAGNARAGGGTYMMEDNDMGSGRNMRSSSNTRAGGNMRAGGGTNIVSSGNMGGGNMGGGNMRAGGGTNIVSSGNMGGGNANYRAGGNYDDAYAGRPSGREVEQDFFREGASYHEGPVVREENKIQRDVIKERAVSPTSYSSNQRLKVSTGAEARGQGLNMQKAPVTKKRYAESESEDDDDSDLDT